MEYLQSVSIFNKLYNLKNEKKSYLLHDDIQLGELGNYLLQKFEFSPSVNCSQAKKDKAKVYFDKIY